MLVAVSRVPGIDQGKVSAILCILTVQLRMSSDSQQGGSSEVEELTCRERQQTVLRMAHELILVCIVPPWPARRPPVGAGFACRRNILLKLFAEIGSRGEKLIR